MGHSLRVARTTVAAACLLSMVGLPSAALAVPPDHAPAHGHESRNRDSARSLSSTQSSTSGVLSTADADTNKKNSPSAKNHDKAGGRGVGTAEHPGQGKATGRPATAGPADPAPSAEEPASAPEPVTPREPVPADPAPAPPTVAEPVVAPQSSTPAAPTSSADTDPTRVPAAVTAPADPVPAPARGMGPTLGEIGQDFADMLEGVAGRVGDLRVPELGPAVTEPVARLVPLLLALLGAFLALQRGIGRGLGHVPMVVTTSHRRDVDASS